MSGTEYGKIETLFNRDTDKDGRKGTFKVLPELGFRLPEFGLIKEWVITEKVDGTNIRIEYNPQGYPDSWEGERGPTIIVRGRTNNADIPPFLLESINVLVDIDKFVEAFDDEARVTLYGEGYGARIQKGGGNYREGTSFRLFDVKVGDWWLNWENVQGVGKTLGLPVVPQLPITTVEESMIAVRGFLGSTVASEENGGKVVMAEGVVARTDPLLFTRKGGRVTWKLKGKDFA